MNITLGSYSVGPQQPLLLLAGPCVLESASLCREVASELVSCCHDLGIQLVFKGSFDKANRTSLASSRGPGMEEGLGILSAIKSEFAIPVVTDVHESVQCAAVAACCDVLQIPAFLCRQTDLLVAAGEAAAAHGGAVNVKKGQFLAPENMEHAVQKVKAAGCSNVLVTERGTTFGYNSLVVDFRSLEIMRKFAPVCFDGTHSVQRPGGGGATTGGDREFVPGLVRAATAVGLDALFLETHPRPSEALSDGPNMLPLHEMRALLETVIRIRSAVGRDK